ncbi:glucosamine-6-phosphate deaminase [Enterococcus plantarum]|uniref:Glucosamine-6-phosphate deaminase n=2 Tax=Enterococcus TaxID=1350 RepID=R2T587_9ENTE|nr:MULTISPECIES: glucosamine-6-phosphate deaminase [Enterococcus]EOI00184.1 glucosamine-6-phosphate deaminase [Enterococcus haemoperoxidus ATCC BAA-382]EOT59578.1 glucosamine-6-phosphate deaminase [Enterococcus haemoperoxidus ATCC BAA-382]OEG18268.1 glucosamine-6-phosphate deaminase [Enterococcus plantarum]OJG52416.1 glucosamine-6-phosphate deaminase [Enterococcus haemoperoxidus]PZL77911.1 glucosamine-6-phosphate deaminase [Enterococcus plantarum]
MKIIKVANAEEGGKKAFELIKEGMDKGAKVLGLATGSTPETLYKEMTASDLDFTDMTSVNLDEYVGLGGDDDQSYRYFMNDQLFNKKPFKNTYVPNGKADDLATECKHYESIIDSNPIDIQILGIGQNGHIGFNEPGTPLDSLTHVVELTESTINANKRNFEKVEDVPTRAVSMGIGSIMKGKKMILMAYGEAKADAIKGMIDGPVSVDLPASALQNHSDVVVIIDEAAASKL